MRRVINVAEYQPLPATEVWFANISVSRFVHSDMGKQRTGKRSKEKSKCGYCAGKKGA